MSKIDLTKFPYYDQYDSLNNYVKLLARPGKSPQSRETNEIQTMIFDHVKRLGDVLLENGSVLSGCQLNVHDKVCTISSGLVYVEGKVRYVDETQLTITSEGDEHIGVIVSSQIVTEEHDSSLLDPAHGYPNYGREGAHRLKEEVAFVVNDSEAYNVFHLRDGELVVMEEPPQISMITDLLARRTYDESSNYKVRGLSVSNEEYDNNNIKLSVSAGKAYVLGYEVIKPAVDSVVVPKAKEFSTTIAEPKIFRGEELEYRLNKAYVRKIERLNGQVLEKQFITRGGSINGFDALPLKPVLDIVAIGQGGTWDEAKREFVGGVTFRENVDYQLVDDGVDWAFAQYTSDQPTPGTSYQVIWKYNRTFTENRDFKVIRKENARYYISFDIATGLKPVEGSQFNINYSWYLARMDLLTIDSNGAIHAIQGQSGSEQSVKPPVGSTYQLPLARVLHLPASEKVTISDINTDRITMPELRKMLKRVNNLEYNVAVTDLEREAEKGESPTQLKGIFTDGFLGFGSADINHPDFNAQLNLFMNWLQLPVQSIPINLTPDEEESVIGEYDKFYTMPHTERVGIQQSLATDTMLVNPYMVFNTDARILLQPSVDNWIEESKVTIPVNITTNSQVDVPAKFIDEWWTSEFERFMLNEEETNTKTTADSTQLLEEVITYMRPLTVSVTGDKYEAHSELRATFGGEKIDLVPIAPTVAGIKPGTVKVDTNGSFKASFVIPESTPTGTRVLAVYNANNYAEKPFTSMGIRKVLAETETMHRHITTYWQEIYGTRNSLTDALAQEALDKSNENAERIEDLENRVDILETSVEAINDEIVGIKSLQRELAEETDNAKKLAIQATIDSRHAVAVAEAAILVANEADRRSELALMKAEIAERNSELALARSNAALSNSQEALRKADEAVEKATESLRLANELSDRQDELEQLTKEMEQDIKNLELDTANIKRQQMLDKQQIMRTISSNVSRLENQIASLSSTVSSNSRRISSNAWRIDPLAQSFVFTDDVLMTSAEVAFSVRGQLPVTVQVRELSEGGFPSLTVVGEQVLLPSDIEISDDGSAMTRIIFPSPVFCKGDTDYCIVFMSEDTDCAMFVADLGQKDLITGQTIGRQPYTHGILFSSSNNVSWDTHQTKNLKFTLNVMDASGNGKLVFKEMSGYQASQLVLAVEQLVPQGAQIDWEYKTSTTPNFLPIKAYQAVELEEIADGVTLRAILKGLPNSPVSPLIIKDSAGMISQLRDTEGSYITKNVELDEPYNTVKQVIDLHLPTGCTAELQFSTNDGKDWHTNESAGIPTRVNNLFSRYTYETSLTRFSPIVSEKNATARTSGGSLPRGKDIYYKITGFNDVGETDAKVFKVKIEGSGSDGSILFDLKDAFDEGLTGFKVYRGTSAGNLALKYISHELLSTFTDSGADTDGSSDTPPEVNTARYSADNFRARINLKTNSPIVMPRATRLINIMRED